MISNVRRCFHPKSLFDIVMHKQVGVRACCSWVSNPSHHLPTTQPYSATRRGNTLLPCLFSTHPYHSHRAIPRLRGGGGKRTGAAADLQGHGSAPSPPERPTEAGRSAGPVVPRGLRTGLPALPHLPAAHHRLCHGHHLHVVHLDQADMSTHIRLGVIRGNGKLM